MNKHLLIINRYFYPDVTSVPQLLTELAIDLRKRGFDISIICSKNSYSGSQTYEPMERYQGINIHRVSNFYGRNQGILIRILEAISFGFAVLLKSMRVRNVSVTMVLSSPPLIAFLGLLIGRMKASKVLYVVEDVHPDVGVALGLMQEESLIVRFIDCLNRYTINRVDEIVVLGRHMKAKVMKKHPSAEAKMVTIPNWADGRAVYPLGRDKNPLIREWKLFDKFIVQYSGNMGLGHDFTTILKGVKLLRQQEDIAFVFIGDGPREKEIVEFQRRHELRNMIVLPYQPYDALLYSLNACDLALVSIRRGMEGLIVPSKIYGILAAGKPYILVGGSQNEIADISREYGIGRIVREGDVEEFRGAVLEYRDNRDRLAQEGKRAREIFEEEFDRRCASVKYGWTLERLTAENSTYRDNGRTA